MGVKAQVPQWGDVKAFSKNYEWSWSHQFIVGKTSAECNRISLFKESTMKCYTQKKTRFFLFFPPLHNLEAGAHDDRNLCHCVSCDFSPLSRKISNRRVNVMTGEAKDTQWKAKCIRLGYGDVVCIAIPKKHIIFIFLYCYKT